MNTLEDRLRAALHAHAEDFSAQPDAWQQLNAKSLAGSGPRPVSGRSWAVRFGVPAAAAAAVIVIVVVAATLAGTFGRTGGSASPLSSSPIATSSPSARPGYSPGGPDEQMLLRVPPTSTIIGLAVPWTGNGTGTGRVVNYFWIGEASPSYWPDQISSGAQFCNDVDNVTGGVSGGVCPPLPQLGGGHLASVTGGENAGKNLSVLMGAAAPQVASVTATLADGRSFPGVVKTGRGFRIKAWTVGYPPSEGDIHLSFRDASGNQVAVLETNGVISPPWTGMPSRGGVMAFSYAASPGLSAGHVEAYLIQGRVAFWSSLWGGQISPLPAAGQPMLGGLADSFLNAPGGWAEREAFGYAHADVARVVLQVAGGRQVSTSTFAPGWPGSDLRLWAVKLALSAVEVSRALPGITATAYDAAGHVLGQVQLGIGN
jgi:hypothetical protein